MTKVKKVKINNVSELSDREYNLSVLREFDLDHKFGPCYGNL